MSCFRELINVRQFCVVQDCTDPLQGICLPDPLQLHLQGTKQALPSARGTAQGRPRAAPRDTAPAGAEGMRGVKEHKLNLCPRMGGRKT